MTKDEALKLALEALENNKQTHYYCEDTWYSCPQHEDGCANDSAGDECNCGADKANAEIDQAITAIKQALAQPDEQLLVANILSEYGLEAIDFVAEFKKAMARPEQEPVIGTKTWFEDDKVVTQYLHPSDIYSTPPQFKPLTDEQISTSYEEYASKFNNYSNYWQALNSEDHFIEGYMAGWKDAHEARSKT